MCRNPAVAACATATTETNQNKFTVLRTFLYCVAVLLAAIPAIVEGALPSGTELRAYLNDTCVVADEPFLLPQDDQVERAFGAIIVGKIAHAIVTGIIRATAAQLDAASKQKDMYFVAARDVDLYHATLAESPGYALNDQLGCVTVVAAEFEPGNADCTHRYVPRLIPGEPIGGGTYESQVTREDNSAENVLRRANICVIGEARSVYEFRFEYSEDRTAFRVESAGLWMNSLLSTGSKTRSRNVVYTVDMTEPGKESEPQMLASAWIHVGEVSAQMDRDPLAWDGRSDWLRVPPMSRAAARAYNRDTAVHQDVYAEVEALQRSAVRNKRLRDGLELRFAEATSDNVRKALQKEMDTVEFRRLQAESMLDARRAEYMDLPQSELHYMPITIRVSIIESRSERRALGTLAAFIEKNSELYADAALETAGVERSFPGAEADDAVALDDARSGYYDALVAVEEASATASDSLEAAQQDLLVARAAYNAARSKAGIPEIE